MAPQPTSVALLRAVSFRISSASKADLPHVAALAARSLFSCRDLLSYPDLSNQKDSDAAIALHRFNTQITSLLQDRTLEGRWAAVVLIKAAIEAGGWETLRKSIAWVRGLLTLLKKPDPPLTRSLTIVTLTRIFMLTWDYPTLIREITTPSLPTFVSTCLNNLNARASAPQELKATLECFAQLLPRHPTIFRQHQDAISKLLLTTFDSKTSGDHVVDLASRISVLLHQCEPKGGASEKWGLTFTMTLQGAHAMADRFFMSIDEDWQSVTGNELINKNVLTALYSKSREATNTSEGPVAQFTALGYQGLLNHLRLISAYFTSVTSGSVVGAVGAVTDLLTRLMAVTISTSSTKSSVRFKRDASREERDALTQALPQVHVACMEVLSALLSRYECALVSVLQSFLDQILWIFHAYSANADIRAASYTITKNILNLSGPSFNKQTIASLKKIITACCEDLLPSESEDKKTQLGNGNKQQSTMNADTFLKQATTASVAKTDLAGLKSAAWELLPTLLGKLRAEQCPVAVRATMDRTAVLIRHKDAMVASTLDHTSSAEAARKNNSLLPLLAREHPADPQVEVLLRPRMPIIQIGQRGKAVEEEEEDMDEDEDEDESESDSVSQSAYDKDLDAEERRNAIPQVERDQVGLIMRPSHSPDDTSRGGESPKGDANSKDMAHAEQDLVDWALHDYAGKKEPGHGRYAAQMTEHSDAQVANASSGKESSRLPTGEWGHSNELQKGKRQREASESEQAEKRQKSSEPQPAMQQQEDAGDSDDDEFVVPEIVMGSDSDEEDE